jgi:hypothetical protein
VCPEADNGVFNTGRCFALVSHRRTWPEYVPPKMRLEWNGEKVTERTSDYIQIRVLLRRKEKKAADLRMEDEFRTFEKMQIPHRDNPVRFIQCCWIFVIRGNTKFGILTTTSTTGH